METVSYYEEELQKIKEWETDQSDLWFWEKLGRLPFKLLDKITPAFVQNKVGALLDEMGSYIQTGGKALSSVSSVKKYYEHLSVSTLEEVASLPIVEMDKAVEKITKSRTKWATIQGATTGVGGFLTLSLDIPVFLSMQMKILQDIAMCYGFDPHDKKERVFIVKCLQFISADIVGKETILKQLANYDKDNAEVQREVMMEMQGWREVVMTYRDSFGWKKLFQMVPVFGIIFGAFANKSSMQDLAEVGHMLYKKRRVLNRLTTLA